MTAVLIWAYVSLNQEVVWGGVAGVNVDNRLTALQRRMGTMGMNK